MTLNLLLAAFQCEVPKRLKPLTGTYNGVYQVWVICGSSVLANKDYFFFIMLTWILMLYYCIQDLQEGVQECVVVLIRKQEARRRHGSEELQQLRACRASIQGRSSACWRGEEDRCLIFKTGILVFVATAFDTSDTESGLRMTSSSMHFQRSEGSLVVGRTLRASLSLITSTRIFTFSLSLN